MNPANRNTLWAGLFVAELAKLGLKQVCLAPGSRSTPLALAFWKTPGFQIYVHNDERSAGYFALGLAQASAQPVALLCTSGTAAANFFPAVVEANTSETPLLLLTADRPAEARDSGANQTIDQVNLFGRHTRWAVDVPAPEAAFSPHLARYLQTLAARALEIAQSPLPGPVQLNFQFRKPLEEQPAPQDKPAWLDETTLAALETSPARVTFSRPRLEASPQQISALRQLLSAPRGVIVAGPRCPGGELPAALTAFAARRGWPILADALSGLRFGPQAQPLILGGYDTFLPQANLPRPQVIVRLGDVPLSPRLNAWLEQAEGVPQLYLSPWPRWRDEQFTLTHFFWLEPLTALQALLAAESPAPDPAWLPPWLESERSAWVQVEQRCADPASEAGIFPLALNELPDGAALFVANSLPVRHLDQTAKPQKKALRVFANRGASGIDGTLSSALGAAAHLPGLLFISGDLTFYHDLNGLLAARRYGLKAVLLVINNDGGGIFSRLPVADCEPPFTELFRTPHGLTFEHAAGLYGLPYERVSRASLAGSLRRALQAEAVTILEIKL